MIPLRTSHLFLPLLPAPQQQIAGVCLGNEASWWEGVATIDDGVPNLLFSSFQSQAVFLELATVDSCTPAKKKMGNGPVIVDKWKRKNPLQSMTLMTLWVPVPASSFPGCLQLHMLESCWFKLLYINWFSWFPWPFHLNLSTPCSSSILKCSYLLPEKHYIHFSFHFFVDQCKENHFANRVKIRPSWKSLSGLLFLFWLRFVTLPRKTQIKKWFLLNLLGINEKIPLIPSNLKRSPVNFPDVPPMFPRSQAFLRTGTRAGCFDDATGHGKKTSFELPRRCFWASATCHLHVKFGSVDLYGCFRNGGTPKWVVYNGKPY